jgi:hypothetical protein
LFILKKNMARSTVSSQLLRSFQARAARIAIGASSMRGNGSAGVVIAARGYLLGLPLTDFGTADANAFRASLDRATNELELALPKKGRYWGLARKGLNIFLRDCLYTVYLREAFSLQLAEEFFEVPLDSISGKSLFEKSFGRLPRWKTVRGLTPALSDQYQIEASRLAVAKKTPRVHLDAIWWGERPDGRS